MWGAAGFNQSLRAELHVHTISTKQGSHSLEDEGSTTVLLQPGLAMHSVNCNTEEGLLYVSRCMLLQLSVPYQMPL